VLTAAAFADRERNLLALMCFARHWFACRIPPAPDATAPWATAGSALTPAPDAAAPAASAGPAQPPKAAMERTVAPPSPAP
jgi:hypothetical protein